MYFQYDAPNDPPPTNALQLEKPLGKNVAEKIAHLQRDVGVIETALTTLRSQFFTVVRVKIKQIPSHVLPHEYDEERDRLAKESKIDVYPFDALAHQATVILKQIVRVLRGRENKQIVESLMVVFRSHLDPYLLPPPLPRSPNEKGKEKEKDQKELTEADAVIHEEDWEESDDLKKMIQDFFRVVRRIVEEDVALIEGFNL